MRETVSVEQLVLSSMSWKRVEILNSVMGSVLNEGMFFQ